VSGGCATEQVGEDRRRVGPGVAQPAQPRVRRDQRDSPTIGQHRVPFDRHRPLAEQPVPPGLQQQPEDADRLQRVVDPEAGSRIAGTHLDPDILAAELGERVLVGDVVPDEQHCPG
jgi:hypothetical protein